MAKIKLVAPVGDIRGELGGVVYSNWRGQAYTRKLATSVANPNSLFAERIRNNTTNLSKLWLSSLTDAQRAAWEEYAQQRGSASIDDKQSSRGNICPPLGRLMSGKNAYIGLNAMLAYYTIAPVAAAPLGVNAPGAPTAISTAFTPGVTPKFTVTWTDPTDLEAGGYVSVWGVCPGTFHKQLVVSVAKGTQTVDITAMRGVGGVAIPLVVGLYRFQVTAFDTHGQRSPGSGVNTVNVTSLT